MTLSEIKHSDKAVLIPAEIAEVLEVNPHSIRLMARERPELLGFPVIVVGTRVKIPRVPFINYIEGQSNQLEGGTVNE